MLTKPQLLDAIDELENSCATYQDCEKLATFYILLDHMYGSEPMQASSREVVINVNEDSEFLQMVHGKDASKVWPVIDEVMETVRAFQPRLYDAALNKLRG